MKPMKIALAGNPNCGKSTLFNALTGSQQRVGNWPGVTVECKSGFFHYGGRRVEVVDLPGLYSMTSVGEVSLDVRIASQAIIEGGFDLIVNIVDTSNLERNLYLTSQLLEMGLPVLLAANMTDVAKKQGIHMDAEQLAQQLGCPVISLAAVQKDSIHPLRKAIIEAIDQPSAARLVVSYPDALKAAVQKLSQDFAADYGHSSSFMAMRALEGDEWTLSQLSSHHQQSVKQQQTFLADNSQEDVDILIADARYTWAHQLVEQIISRQTTTALTLTQKIDRIVLNRFFGIPIFLGMMYLMFFCSINVGGAFQPFFDTTSSAIFIHGFYQLLMFLQVPASITALLAAGFGASMNTVITFIPVIAVMFLFLAILESSGYMARAAFVVDRLMRAVGLPGKSFVPLIVGFGCNVPAILATRTLDNKRDRLITLMMSPFMSCSARMAIYAVFTAAFFPSNGQNIVFILYLCGILAAVMTGLVLRKTLLKGDSSPWIIELPSYHRPSFSTLFRQTWQRLHQFLFRAGKLIVPLCLIICTLNAITISGSLTMKDADQNSLLSSVGKALTPVFKPMGIGEDNWPAVVGLMTGMLAKEVVVGTLNTLYTQVGHLSVAAPDNVSVLAELREAVVSLPGQLAGLKDSFSNPIAASAADGSVDNGVMGVMAKFFAGSAGAMAYLLFVLLYFPCVSAVAAMIRESSFRWAAFSMAWTTGLAYAVAVIFYQSATWLLHPFSSSLWISGILLAFVTVICFIKQYADADDKQRLEAVKNVTI